MISKLNIRNISVMRNLIAYERKKLAFTKIPIFTIFAIIGITLLFWGWLKVMDINWPKTQIEQLTKQEKEVQNLLKIPDLSDPDPLYKLQNAISELRCAYQNKGEAAVSLKSDYETCLLNAKQNGFSVGNNRTEEEIHLEIQRLEKMESMGIEIFPSPYELSFINGLYLFFFGKFIFGFLLIELLYAGYVIGWETESNTYIPLYTSKASRTSILCAKLIVCIQSVAKGMIIAAILFGIGGLIFGRGCFDLPVIFHNKLWSEGNLLIQLVVNALLVFVFCIECEAGLYALFFRQTIMIPGGIIIGLIGLFSSGVPLLRFFSIALVQTNTLTQFLCKIGILVLLFWLSVGKLKRKDLIK